MTQKEKLAAFDKVQSEGSRYILAMHDMVNRKFSFPVIEKTAEKGEGRYKVQMSNRAMPLFLVTYQHGCQDDQITVLDEFAARLSQCKVRFASIAARLASSAAFTRTGI